ncbi:MULTISPECIES: helix-turn-helix domain-containing protein [Bradyrhizobium]|uniref:hypothetical protein n=1 Tax=Bradyrhizobium centrosematis TaxID=1300039 RepID=UPI0021694717|nr:hypothetical protein [Bradyrhizobium centrosematis]MCS3765932.1 hypothetical protein [Bradyrhizobium centrosematis]MCS3778338.1 hypothetical protein [Bradyrhizobium centrosematis]
MCLTYRPPASAASKSYARLNLREYMLASAELRLELGALDLAEVNLTAYIHGVLCSRHAPTTESDARRESLKLSDPNRGSVCLLSTPLDGSAAGSPVETDMQEYFRVSPPSVHQMVLTLERAGLITEYKEPLAA